MIFIIHDIMKIKNLKFQFEDGLSGTPGTPVKPTHLEIMGNGNGRSTNGNFFATIL
jgi:hypothetical protein